MIGAKKMTGRGRKGTFLDSRSIFLRSIKRQSEAIPYYWLLINL